MAVRSAATTSRSGTGPRSSSKRQRRSLDSPSRLRGGPADASHRSVPPTGGGERPTVARSATGRASRTMSGMSRTDAVTVRGLRKRYGDRTVVDGIDLDVREAEIVGLIGANGAGKTTTVECIQGITRPNSGTLRVFGLDPMTHVDQVRRLIGSQLQDSSLPDRLRVEEAVRLFATGPHDGDDLLEQFGLVAMRRAAFSSLSGGERQRLFLVLALLNRPRLVILDELTQGLDPAARRDVWAAVAQLQQEGTTVLLVTHELDEAEALCGRVIAMRNGRILDQGRPADVVARHAGWARISFTGGDTALLDRLARLPGVQRVELVGDRVLVHGDRPSIARVGAELVHGGEVPPDLDVVLPDLEAALLHLLDETTIATPDHEELVSN